MKNIDVQEQTNINPKAFAERELGTKNIKSLFYRYILLAILGNIFLVVPSFVDGNIVGQLGTKEMAGVGIGYTVQVLSRAIGVLIGVGAGAVVALRLGAGKIDEARSIAGQSIWLGVIVSTVISIFGYIYNEPLMRLFGANDAALPSAIQFGNQAWIFFPFQVLAVILSILAILDERPGLSTWSWFAGSILAAVVELILFHKFQYGVVASAWSNNICTSFPCLLIFYFLFSKTLLKPKLKDIRIKFSNIIEVNATGFASFSIQLTMFISIIVINNLLASLGGELHVSAFTIQNGYIANSLILLILGITTGIQPLISYNYGAGLYNRVREATSLGIKFTLIMSICFTALLFIYTDSIVRFFTGGDAALQDIAVWSTRVLNFTFPLGAIILLISCYFEAIEQNIKATFIAIGRSFIFSIPLFYILSHFLGVNGVWYSMPVADVLSFIVAIFFMYREFNRLKSINENEKYRDIEEII
jgi:putative MATE family efflux protein